MTWQAKCRVTVLIMKRSGLVALAVVLLLGNVAFAHYQFVHYTNTEGRIVSVPEKFDLNALPNRTLYFFIPENGPQMVGAGFPALLSQIRAAARVWSDVQTSGLRIEFGGFAAPGTEQKTPGIDVIFVEPNELPAGLVALGGPTSRSPLVTGETGSFVPITRSVLKLPKDLSQRPSYSEAVFLTLVHEFGHALGLQHTLTSSVMSTEVTRSTTRSRPLAADDVAGISTLYPAPGFLSGTASISGRVTMDGQAVHMASVVALDPAGTAVSALTDPDGFYRIAGLSPGEYYLYVHPLPPGKQTDLGPAEIVLPVGSDGKPVPAGPLFETVFYRDTKSVLQAAMVSAQPGQRLAGYDFAVKPRGSLDLYGVTTYSFPGAYAVKPAFVNVNNAGRNFLVAAGAGLIVDDAPAPGLGAGVVGGSATVMEDGVKAYKTAPSFLQLDFSFSPFGGQGPRHLVFSRDGSIFVLPAGLHLVRSQPPSIASVTPGEPKDGRPTAILIGSNLTAFTRVLFDGWPAPIVAQNEDSGALTVVPPPGTPDLRAVVTALDDDGQGSMFLDSASPPQYTYGPAAQPSVTVSPSALPAGSEAMIEIRGANTNFAEGQAVVGFGTSDVAVRRVWVMGPDRLLANVHINEGASQASAALTVVSGFQISTQPQALQVQAPRLDVPVADPVLVNPLTGQASVYAGGQATLAVAHLVSPIESPAAEITLNDLQAKILAVEPGRITFEVPAALGLGPAVLRLKVAGISSQPVVVAIELPPPVIHEVFAFGHIAVDSVRPAAPGEDLWVTVSGLADPSAVSNPGRITINLGGVLHAALEVAEAEIETDTYGVRFRISPAVAAGPGVPLSVIAGTRVSQSHPIAVITLP